MRQARSVQHFVAVKVGDRNFGGRNQPQIFFAVGHAEEVGSKFRQLSGAIHGLGIHQVRRQHLGVAVLAGVQIEHEIGQRPLQPRSQVPVHREARAGKLGGAFEIEHAQRFTQFPVRFGREIELRRRAPAPDFNIIFGRLSHGHAFVGQIGDAGENVLQAGLRTLPPLSRCC